MKKLLLVPALLLIVIGLAAQETTVSVKVKEDGKVVKDTTYVYESAEEAEMAVKILNLLMESQGDVSEKHSKKMVFISEDGEKTMIHGDSTVWVEHGDHDCKHTKVVKVNVDEGEHGKRVVIVSSDDGETFDILLDEDCDHDVDGEKVVVKKEVKVIVESDEDGDWEVIEKEVKEFDTDEDTEVIVIKKKKQKKPEKQ